MARFVAIEQDSVDGPAVVDTAEARTASFRAFDPADMAATILNEMPHAAVGLAWLPATATELAAAIIPNETPTEN